MSRARNHIRWGILGAALFCLGAGVLWRHPQSERETATAQERTAQAIPATPLEAIPFDGEQAYQYLQSICDLGRRPTGSPGMQAQRKLIAEHFQGLGAQVRQQPFAFRHPVDGSRVEGANVIVHWHPQTKERLLLCAHIDTKPYPSEDPVRPTGHFIGANDGASGLAALMEMGRHMKQLSGPLGIDFVFFDAEEFVFNERDTYFLGSRWFARMYVADPPNYRYRYGVLLDMVGDADLLIKRDYYSVKWKDTRPLVDDIWRVARELGVREFVSRRGPIVLDDHIPLRNTARIPTCDIIDFDYPYWHTEADIPGNCSADSLGKVGSVVWEWLRQMQQGHTF